MDKTALFDCIEENVKLEMADAQKERERVGSLDSKWTSLLGNDVRTYIGTDGKLNRKALENFRNPRQHLVIPDAPTFSRLNFLSGGFAAGGRRGQIRMLCELLDVLEALGHLPLLAQHPVPDAGGACVFRRKGYQYTYRWTRHIRMLSLFRKHLDTIIGDAPVILDIGSGWGMFSYLMKKEKPSSTNILLDFPEMLVFAHAFLGQCFPEARIASYRELKEKSSLDRAFLSSFDFVLLPHFMYAQIEAGAVNLVSNVASFGEMRREWFSHYTDNEPFRSARFFMTANRFESAPALEPTYDTDLTVLDYPLSDFNALRFGVCPVFSHIYDAYWKFFYKRHQFSSQYFEFVGQRISPDSPKGNP